MNDTSNVTSLNKRGHLLRRCMCRTRSPHSMPRYRAGCVGLRTTYVLLRYNGPCRSWQSILHTCAVPIRRVVVLIGPSLDFVSRKVALVLPVPDHPVSLAVCEAAASRRFLMSRFLPPDWPLKARRVCRCEGRLPAAVPCPTWLRHGTLQARESSS